MSLSGYDYWVQLNRFRHCCPCGYNTHNKHNMKRHQDTTACYVWTHKTELPWDIRKIIMAFAHGFFVSYYHRYLTAYSLFSSRSASTRVNQKQSPPPSPPVCSGRGSVFEPG